MPRIVREADIEWEGTTARGSGVVRASSSGAFDLPSTIASRVDVHCTITMDEVEGQGHRIVDSAISARAVVPGADGATFAEAAAAADEGCPFSALIRGTATVTYEATLEGGS